MTVCSLYVSWNSTTRTMSKYIITPWRTQADLLQVRQQLYNLQPAQNGTDFRRRAVDRIMAWKLRGNLPHAVESTALLVDATLHHHASQANSMFSIRAVYSAAFTRFVTGFCDIGRARERMLDPSSMLDIARQIGMPSEFVALRHEATHEEMPSLKRLVQATGEALDWLWKVYWSRLEGSEVRPATAEEMTRVRDEARSALRSFRSSRREVLRQGALATVQQQQAMQGALEQCVELCSFTAQNVMLLVELLVDERLILPSTRE